MQTKSLNYLLIIALICRVSPSLADGEKDEEDELYERWRLLYDSLFMAGKSEPFSGAETQMNASDIISELGELLNSKKAKLAELSQIERNEVQWWIKSLNRIALLECSAQYEKSIDERRKRLVENSMRELYYDTAVPTDIKLDDYIEEIRLLMFKMCSKFRGNELNIELGRVAEQVDHLRPLLTGSETFADIYACLLGNGKTEEDKSLREEQHRVALASRLGLFAGLRKCPAKEKRKLFACKSIAKKEFKRCYTETVLKPCEIIEKAIKPESHLEDFVGYLKLHKFRGATVLVQDWYRLRELCRNELADERLKRLAFEILHS